MNRDEYEKRNEVKSSDPRILTLMMTRDEEDMVAHALKHLLVFSDTILVMDKSNDRTPHILKGFMSAHPDKIRGILDQEDIYPKARYPQRWSDGMREALLREAEPGSFPTSGILTQIAGCSVSAPGPLSGPGVESVP